MLSVTALIIVALSAGFLAPACAAEIVPDWESIPVNPYPLMPALLVEPVLTAEDVTDVSALFVADPFLMHEDGIWHMFLEVYSGRGKIGHATSTDGLHWTYDRLVLTESYHLANPYVFKCDGSYYMTVLGEDYSVGLYKADAFPYEWHYWRTIVTGRHYADPFVFQHDGILWLFVGESSTGYCYLFSSGNLGGPWIEHPMSPIVNDVSEGRPAGPPFVYGNGRVVRLGMKNDQWYGQAVRAFEVDLLTRTVYVEHEIPESPILWDSGHGWNSDGMHTCNAWWDGDHWLASVDGIADWWSIGIYRTVAMPAGVEGSAAGREPQRIELGPIEPNPFATSTRILFELAGGAPEVPARIAVHQVDGRLVRVLQDGLLQPGTVAVQWDGCDDRGLRMPAGTYFCRLERAGHSATGRMVLLK